MTAKRIRRGIALVALVASLTVPTCQTGRRRPAPIGPRPAVHQVSVVNDTYDVVIVWLEIGPRSRRLGPVDNRGTRTFRVPEDVICGTRCRLRGIPVGSPDVLLSPPIQLRAGWMPVWRMTTNPITSTVELRRVG